MVQSGLHESYEALRNKGRVFGKVENLIPLIEKMDKDKNDCDYLLRLLPNGKVFLTRDEHSKGIGTLYMSKETAEYIREQINENR